LDVQARLLYGLIHARWIVTARGLAKMVCLIHFIYKISLHMYPVVVVFIQLEKYKRVDFGRCPRVLCQSQPLLPVGLTDVAYEKSVKLYCGRCEDIYSPKSSRHGSIDGAYFGTSFPHLLFMCYPALIPTKSGSMDGPGFRGGAPESTESSGNGGRRPRRGREDTGTGETVGSEVTSTAAVALKAERYRPRIFGFQVNEIAKLQRWQEAVRDRSVFSHVRKSHYSGKPRQIARLEDWEENNE
jgi:casein kinase II subunit beta